MSFQECQKTKNHSDQQGSHLKASVRYLVYSRLSGLQPGGGVAVTSSFSQIVSFSPSTLGKQRFQTVPFSNRSTLESVFETIRFRTRRCSVEVSRIRNKTVSFSFENGVVWTGSKMSE